MLRVWNHISTFELLGHIEIDKRLGSFGPKRRRDYTTGLTSVNDERTVNTLESWHPSQKGLLEDHQPARCLLLAQ